MQFALEGTATYPVDYRFSLKSPGDEEVLQITPAENRLDLTLQIPARTYTVGTPLNRVLILNSHRRHDYGGKRDGDTDLERGVGIRAGNTVPAYADDHRRRRIDDVVFWIRR